MKNPKFSVLIPVYNVEAYLIDCIESVLQQTYSDFEVIITNDGSTDSSGLICEQYANKDPRIRVFHQKNHGLILTRRKAIRKAKGSYLLFLDSDDFWEKDLLEQINCIICDYNSDLIIFKFNKVSHKGHYISTADTLFNDRSVFYQGDKEKLFRVIISSSKLNNLWCKAVKRNIIDDTDYSKYQGLIEAEDLLQTLPLIYNATKIVYMDEPLYNYRERAKSITNSYNIQSIDSVSFVRSQVLNYIRLMGFDTEENLASFYQYFILFLLNYTAATIKTNLSIKEKIHILNKCKDNQLYVDSLGYMNEFQFSTAYKLRLFLFKENHTWSLIMLESLIRIMRHIKSVFL